jgi:MFS family permease
VSPTQLAGVLASLRRNRALGRVELAFLLATIVEWAGWLALVVFAFDRGGATEAGLIGFAIAVPAVVVAPTAAILGDRFPRQRVMFVAYLGQAFAFAATGAAFLLDAAILGYVLGIAATALIALTRPLLASVLPEVATSPGELTAANVASGLGEGLGALGGSLGAGILFGLLGVPYVLVASAGAMTAAALLVLPLAMRARRIELEAIRPIGADAVTSLLAVTREMAAGAATILRDHRLTALSGLMSATIGILGALNVLIVIVAIDVLGFAEDAAGYLAAVTGVGALVGALSATALVGRERIAAPLLGSIGGFAVATAAVGLGSTPLPVVIALAATGVGWSIAWVAATTMIQRLAGDDVMTRVFGVNESLQTGAEAIGGLLVPLLVVIAGPGGALIILGIGLALITALVAPTLLRADRVDPGRLRDIATIRAVPMLAPLSGPVIERLAASAEHVVAISGSRIVGEGDPGDRFYIVVDGRVRVTANGRDAGELGPGGAFGEIALLRDVPRTATVVAIDHTDLLAIRRDPFLEALTGQPRSRVVAAGVVEEHLAADVAAS